MKIKRIYVVGTAFSISVLTCAALLVWAIVLVIQSNDSDLDKDDNFRARCDSAYGTTYIGRNENICYRDGSVLFSEK